ncbi:MAG: hypothetical protein RSE41_00485 [Clostridia bacterium]
MKTITFKIHKSDYTKQVYEVVIIYLTMATICKRIDSCIEYENFFEVVGSESVYNDMQKLINK